MGEEHAFKAGFKSDDALHQFGFKQRHFTAVFAHFQAVETEHGADDDADEDVHEGRDAVFTDTGQRGAVFFNQLDAEALDSAILLGSILRMAAGRSWLFLVSSKIAASFASIKPTWPPCIRW